MSSTEIAGGSKKLKTKTSHRPMRMVLASLTKPAIIKKIKCYKKIILLKKSVPR